MILEVILHDLTDLGHIWWALLLCIVPESMVEGFSAEVVFGESFRFLDVVMDVVMDDACMDGVMDFMDSLFLPP